MIPAAWKVDNGTCWIQTRCPKASKKLSKVKGAKLVAQSHTGEYLRTYEVPWTLTRSREWVIRTVKSIYGTKEAARISRQSQASLTWEVAA